ncbi:flagellar protein FliT [Janthinobacterium fluminis]
MTNQQVLSTYEAMRALTQQMVAAAGDGAWDQLETLEQRVSVHVQALRENEESVRLEGPHRLQKIALIKQMLEDDRKIRDLTMPWMAQLSKLINNTGAERRLAGAYGTV